MNVYEFICSNIDRTTKTYDAEYEDGIDIPLIPLPYAFTTPCAEGMFQEMYYWDTYFTHKCLLLTDREEQVLNNIKNFVYLLETYGKIPNGNRMHYLNRSQPPFFGMMLADLLERRPDMMSKRQAYEWLLKEYEFWQTQRICENGLNRYSCEMTDEEALGLPGYSHEVHTERYEERTGIHLENTVENGKCVIAECESGWDFSPRFDSQCRNYNPVDLNSLLYADEMLLALWAKELGRQEENEYYIKCARERRDKVLAFMKKDGIYYDYDFVSDCKSGVVSCAAFFPYFVGIDEDREGFLKTLAILEDAYGVIACTSEENRYQWAEPNSWAPLNYIAVAAAHRLGLQDDARRLVDKYLLVTEKIFDKTERLWEKFNAKTGDLEVASEYGTPEMLGWSAGTYIAFYEYKKTGYKNLL